ncbi:hypothetical protein [Lacticaseibacillus suibinensis]|uniref:hypothetical protein n=1 Tax=Lacticaseibacillus suibinensis TaxID=2486011 RepID=UPI000F7A89F8|nr:hypothetical protein [Lacticaseibacillus suibinensis]
MKPDRKTKRIIATKVKWAYWLGLGAAVLFLVAAVVAWFQHHGFYAILFACFAVAEFLIQYRFMRAER